MYAWWKVWAAGALANEPDQRRAIAIIGLEPARAELAASRGRLGWCEQPHRPRPPALDLRRPRAMQRPLRLQLDHRRPRNTAAADQPLELGRVALRLACPGTVGEAVAEGEDDCVARQALDASALAACAGEEQRYGKEKG